MSADKTKTSDYKALTPAAKNGGASSHAQPSLKAPGSSQNNSHKKGENSQNLKPYNKFQDHSNSQNLTNLHLKNTKEFPSDSFTSNLEKEETAQTEIFILPENYSNEAVDLPYAEQQKRRKRKQS